MWLEQAKGTVVGEELRGVMEDQITWGLARNSKDLGLPSKRNSEPVLGLGREMIKFTFLKDCLATVFKIVLEHQEY